MRSARTLGSGRSGAPLAAVLAVFALLIQALLPAAAMAAQAGGDRGETIVICTQMGVQTLTVGGKHPAPKGFAGLPCHDCLAAATAALPAPEPAAAPAVYETARIEHAGARRWAPQLARAPPRPPGQGPPLA